VGVGVGVGVFVCVCVCVGALFRMRERIVYLHHDKNPLA
jgi:hypothetical protein